MRAFLDSSAIIFAFDFEESNSAIILDLILDKKIEAITCEKVLIEVRNYFSNRRNKKFSFLIETILRKNFKTAKQEEILLNLNNWKNQIKEKDLEQLTAVKILGIKKLIAFDRDYKPFPEYVTPKKFVEELGLKAKQTEY